MVKGSNSSGWPRGLALAFCIGLLGPAHAGDPTRGKLLYENHCTVCHTSQVHVRKTHKAKSTQDIRAYVLRWREELELDWSEAEVSDVTDYLNLTYYGYAPGS